MCGFPTISFGKTIGPHPYAVKARRMRQHRKQDCHPEPARSRRAKPRDLLFAFCFLLFAFCFFGRAGSLNARCGLFYESGYGGPTSATRPG